MYTVKIVGEDNNEIHPILDEDASPAEYFAGCVNLYIDLLAGGQKTNKLMRPLHPIDEPVIANTLASQTAIVMFLSALHEHSEFDKNKVFKSSNPNYSLFQNIAPLLQKKISDTSTQNKFIDIICKFKIPGVKSITIKNLESLNQQRLTNINFPDTLIPEEYKSPISQQIMDKPSYSAEMPKYIFDFIDFEKNEKKHPYTRVELKPKDLKTDDQLKNLIETFIQKAELIFEKFPKNYTEKYKEYKNKILDSTLCLNVFKKVFNSNLHGNVFNNPISLLYRKYKVLKTQKHTGDFEKILRKAAAIGNSKDLHYLLSKMKIDPNATDSNQKVLRTALHWVVINANKTTNIIKYKACMEIRRGSKIGYFG